MQEEVLNKLHTALYSISPLASDREQIIEQMGETIWIETLEKIISSLSPEKQQEIVALLNNNDIEGAVEFLESHNIDVDAILTEVATSVMDEAVSGE